MLLYINKCITALIGVAPKNTKSINLTKARNFKTNPKNGPSTSGCLHYTIKMPRDAPTLANRPSCHCGRVKSLSRRDRLSVTEVTRVGFKTHPEQSDR